MINILSDFSKHQLSRRTIALNLSAFDSPQLLFNGASQNPSFPYVFSGNPGETRTGPDLNIWGDESSHVTVFYLFLFRAIESTLLTGFFPVKLAFSNSNSS